MVEYRTKPNYKNKVHITDNIIPVRTFILFNIQCLTSTYRKIIKPRRLRINVIMLEKKITNMLVTIRCRIQEMQRHILKKEHRQERNDSSELWQNQESKTGQFTRGSGFNLGRGNFLSLLTNAKRDFYFYFLLFFFFFFEQHLRYFDNCSSKIFFPQILILSENSQIVISTMLGWIKFQLIQNQRL